MGLSKTIYQQFVDFHPKEYIDVKSITVRDDILKHTRHLIPIEGWTVYRSGVWQYFQPIDENIPTQGWKIHISATYDNCINVAEICIKLLVKQNVFFKILADKRSYDFMNCKIQNRGSSGKYITVYPRSIEHFKEIIALLNEVVGSYDGPYILSDRRYRDSKCIYYRYGGMQLNVKKSYDGIDEPVLITPDGQSVKDGRQPYCDFPEWVIDPFEDECWFKEQYTSNTNNNGLLQNRYRIESVLHFSVTGGVYKAQDLLDNKTVVIKEARPFTSSGENEDAVSRLKDEKEFIVNLQNIADIPGFIDFFKEWEHYFLVMEYIDGINFVTFMNQNNPLCNLNSPYSQKEYRSSLLFIWRALAENIKRIHDEGWVLGDLSINNIMILNNVENSPSPVILDFEGAFYDSNKTYKDLVTPGFSPKDLSIDPKKRDIYAFASVIISSIYPLNSIYHILPEKQTIAFRNHLLYLTGFDFKLSEMLDDILLEKFHKFNSLSTILEFLENYPVESSNSMASKPLCLRDVNEFKSRLLQGMLGNIDLYRQDRIVPCDPHGYFINNFNVSFGALGVAHALNYVQDGIPGALGGWLLDKDYKSHAPGLFNGLSGLAWVLLDCGYEKLAFNILENIITNSDNFKDASFYNGASGIGLTALKTYHHTSDSKWLNYAISIGNKISSMANRSDDAVYWDTYRGLTHTNFTYGTAGVSYFFLELYLATNDKTYLDLVRLGVNFTVANLVTSKSHTTTFNTPLQADKKGVSPYWIDGTSGVLQLLLRYWKVTEDKDIFNTIKSLLNDLKRPITPFPSLGEGMAGIINILIDAILILNDTTYGEYINQYIETLQKYEVVSLTHNHSSIPGQQLYRISDDYLTGSSGVICVLERYSRLLNKGNVYNFNFTLDQYHEFYYLNTGGHDENSPKE